MKYFIGLDAHSTTSTFAVLDKERQFRLRKTVDTSEKNLLSVINQVQGERYRTFVAKKQGARLRPLWTYDLRKRFLEIRFWLKYQGTGKLAEDLGCMTNYLIWV